MQALRFHDYGDPSVLRSEEVPTPTPGPGEVRLRAAGAAFNPVDDGIRGGWLRQEFPIELPYTTGIEVSGTVDALGEGVTGTQVGDPVVAFLPMLAGGAAAEFAIAPAEVLAAAPTSTPLADAAALPMVALTAWQALFEHAGLEAGQRVLISGAGGAVGSYAVQLAAHAGAHVIATASPRSEARVRAAGADEVIDHTAADVAGAVDEPVDAVVNLARIAPEQLAALTARVRDGGVVVNTVPAVPAPGDEARGVRASAVFVRSDVAQLARLVELVDAGALHIDIAERVALSDLPAVHERAAAGEISGKVIAVVSADASA